MGALAVALLAVLALDLHPVDRRDYTDPAPWAFLAQLLPDAEVVALAESIHMTHELPLVRLGIARALNERLGFQVLAMEGSAVDVWVAQDLLLEGGAGGGLGGFFPLWNTPEVQRLIAYEVASWESPRPFYVTSYDVQPGTGAAWYGPDVFRRLAERLARYAPPPAGIDGERLAADLGPLTRQCGAYDGSRISSALAALETWIGQAAPEVARRFPRLPHAAVLGLLPRNLEGARALCDDLAQNRGPYRPRRDTHAAAFALALKGTVPGGKLLLWAHVSHLRKTAARGPTVASLLAHSLGRRLYAIAPFAEAGGTLVVYDGDDDVGYARVDGARSPLGKRLAAASREDYFLDLRGTSEPSFTTPQSIAVESFQLPTVLADDFDGIVWVKTVHAPDWPLPRLVLYGGMHHRFLIAALALAVVVGVVLFWRARRARVNV